MSYVSIAFWYLGITIGAHALPSEDDTTGAANYKELIQLRIVHLVFVALNKLRFFWVDYLYAYLIILIPTIILINIVPDFKVHEQTNIIVKEVVRFKKSIESNRTLKLSEGEVSAISWQRINKKTEVAKDISNPFGGIYSATVFNIDAQQENGVYQEIAVVIIAVNEIPEAVCKQMLTKEIKGMDETGDNRPMLVQTQEEIEAGVPPVCKDNNMILFPFNLKRQT